MQSANLIRSNMTALIFSAVIFVFSSCGIYSHSGASIPPDAKTFYVEYLPNQASIVMPTLSQTLTEKLKQKFTTETPLKLGGKDADLYFNGKITEYKIIPAAVQGDQQNAVNRLSITIEISFENRKDETKNFTQTFTNTADYPASQNLNDREKDLVENISTMLVSEVFNKAFINW